MAGGVTANLIGGKKIFCLESAVCELVAHACNDLGLGNVADLSNYEKELVIGATVDLGALAFRNAVADISTCLNMSRSTVYLNIKRHHNLRRRRKRKA